MTEFVQPPQEIQPELAPVVERYSRFSRITNMASKLALVGAVTYSGLFGQNSHSSEPVDQHYATAASSISWEAADTVRPLEIAAAAEPLEAADPPKDDPLADIPEFQTPAKPKQEAAPPPKPATEVAKPADKREKVGNTVYFNQGDKPWKASPYHGKGGGGNIGFNGCGPSSLAIAISTLSEKTVTPVEMASYNMQHGYVNAGGSTYHSALHNVPKKYGLETRPVSRTLPEVKAVTDKGGLVFINGTDRNASTPAMPGGHIFVIRGVTPDNKLLLADPASRANSQKSWNPNDIFRPASVAVAVSKPGEKPAPAPAEDKKLKPEPSKRHDKESPDSSRSSERDKPLPTIDDIPEFSLVNEGQPQTPALADLDTSKIPELNGGVQPEAAKPVTPVPSAEKAVANPNPYPANTLKNVLYQAGFRDGSLETAYAVAMAESRANAKAYNGNASTGDKSYGLFQINMLGSMGPARLKAYKLPNYEALYDPTTNAVVAFKMSGGGKNWQPWSTFKRGEHRKFLNAKANTPIVNATK